MSALKPLESLVGEIKTLIEQSRRQVAVTVNAAMTTLYWQIGRRINQEVLKEQRAEYGRQIVVFGGLNACVDELQKILTMIDEEEGE